MSSFIEERVTDVHGSHYLCVSAYVCMYVCMYVWMDR